MTTDAKNKLGSAVSFILEGAKREPIIIGIHFNWYYINYEGAPCNGKPLGRPGRAIKIKSVLNSKIMRNKTFFKEINWKV